MLDTKQTGMIAMAAKEIGQMRIITVHLKSSLCKPQHMSAVRSLSGKQPYTAGRTGGRCAVSLTEQSAFLRQTHYIRGFYVYAERFQKPAAVMRMYI